MRFRTTLLLILVLAALGGYVYWVEYPQSQVETTKQKLYDFKPDDATELTLAYADRRVVLTKSGDEWRLTQPIQALADAATIRNLVNAIAECEIKKELTETSSDLAQYGLEAPFVTVTLKLKDKELAAVAVGRNAPIGSATYVKKGDDPKIMLANSAFRSGLDKQVNDFRDKTILNFTDDDLQRVELTAEGKDIALLRKDGNWSMERPAPFPADTAAVRSFLSSLRAIRASDFPAESAPDPSQYGLDTPQLRIRLLIGKDNIEKVVVFGNKVSDKKEPYVQVSGSTTVYTTGEFSLKDLNKNANDFRDKTLLAFDRDSARVIQVSRKDGGEFTLRRGDDKQWNVDGSEGKPAAPIASQYIGDVRDLKGYEILADNPADLVEYGLDQPLLTIHVFAADQKPLGTIKIAERPNTEGKKEYTAVAAGGSTVFLVRDYTITRLNKQAKDFIATAVPAPAGAAAGVGAAPAMPMHGFGNEDVDGQDLGEEDLGGGDFGDPE